MKRRNRCVCLSPFLMLMVMILLFAGQVWASAPVSNPRCTAVSKPGDGAAKMAVRNAWGTLPLSFIRNDGQLDKRVKFYEKGSGHATYFTGDGIYILLVGEKRGSSSSLTGEDGPSSAGMNRRTSFIKLAPIDANTTQHITAEGLQSGKINYFMTRNPEKWKTDIPTYRTVVYREVYAGVDMKFYGNNSLLEYDIIVKPGAEPKTIRLAYEGIHGLSVTKEGDLAITLDGGTIIQKKPSVYQEFDGIKREIAGRFRVFDDVPVDKASGSTGAARRFVYGFEVASYDTTHPLIIDPVLVFSTYLGGSALDSAYDIAVDGSGNIYVTGSTFSSDFPTASAMYTKNTPGVSNSDAFVTKLSSSGSALVYSTYLGGSSDDSANGIAVDSLRNVYITGRTKSSTSYPTSLPAGSALYDTYQGGVADAFVTKISASGSTLDYSTFIGGSLEDYGVAIAVDSAGNAYMAGTTKSTDIPKTNAPNAYEGGAADVFVARISADGKTHVYTRYIGGTDYDYMDHGRGAIAVNNAGNIYITGTTASSDFPTSSPYLNANQGGYDAFIAKVNTAGTALDYATYLGGTDDDSGGGIAIDSAEYMYVTGTTSSNDFPTASAIYSTYEGGTSDAFVTKLTPSGAALVFSTYLGGSAADDGNDIAIDSSENIYVTGPTASLDFPAVVAVYPSFSGGVSDVYVAKIGAAGDGLLYSTYVGGSGKEISWAIAVDSSGNAYVTGETNSTDYPVKSALYGSNSGGTYDAFITEISPSAGGGSSDAGGGGSCFIATAAYGSSSDRTVTILRNFRDKILLSRPWGRYIVNAYYRVSPPLADFVERHEAVSAMFRWSLFPVVGMSSAVMHLGLPISTMLLMMLVVLTDIFGSFCRRKVLTQQARK